MDTKVSEREGASARVDRSDALNAARRFRTLNHDRFERLLAMLPRSQRGFLELLPLLLHSDHPQLPGYAGTRAPCGFPGYRPSRHVLAIAQSVARSFRWTRQGSVGGDLDALYLMGSSGTIAYSSGSDFDFWLCHRDDLDADGIAALESKAEAISAWGARLGLETHFFVMSARGFRDGGASALSSESSGSAQHRLLLDEFYRTALLLAGRAPLWWLVPPEDDAHHEEFVAKLVEGRYVRSGDYLDFGPVAGVSAAEFFGATLWQLAKAVAAPYKSLLKLLLLEAYASAYPSPELLSTRFKRAVYAGDTEIANLDPYLLMVRHIEEHLAALGDQDRIELARRCLYFKVGQPLSVGGTGGGDWRRTMLGKLCAEWGWDRSHLSLLDQRKRWKIERTLKERRTLVSALSASYRRLSLFARAHAEVAMVSDRDMTLLGRRLFAAFEHKAGKIDAVNPGISKDLSEPRLVLQEVVTEQGQNAWCTWPDRGGRASAAPVKRGWTALEVVAWLHFNGLLGPGSRVTVAAAGSELNERDVVELHGFLARHFPPGPVCTPAPVEDLERPPRLLGAATVVNLGLDPLSGLFGGGRAVTTQRMDPLSYSGWHENLVREIDYLVVTSWHEALTFKYQGMDGLLTCLCEHLRWVERGLATDPVPHHPRCCAPRYEGTIARRIDELFADVTSWYIAPGCAKRRRYVLRGGDSYFSILATPELVTHEFSGTHTELLDLLAVPNPDFTSVTFDRYALDDPVLALVYDASRPGLVQFFFRAEGKLADVYVLDECGALFHDTVTFHSGNALVAQYQRFFDAVALRRTASTAPDDDAGAPETEFGEVVRDRTGATTLTRVEWEQDTPGAGFVDIKVIGELIDGETVFTVYCNGVEFSTQEYGLHLFEEVARHIVSLRRSGETYPVYISDIDLSRLPTATGSPADRPTIQYLEYKRRIERRLNRGLG